MGDFTLPVVPSALSAVMMLRLVLLLLMMMMMMMMTDTEHAWIDVLIDLLMSSLSEDHSLVRVVINSAFIHLIPHLTTDSSTLILDVSSCLYMLCTVTL